MNAKRPLLAAILLLASINLTRADAVTDWNEQLERAMKTAALNPGVQGRFAATVHVAIYDAANGIALQYAPFFIHEHGPLGARQDAAAVQAAYTTLSGLFSTQAVTLDAAFAQALAQLPDSQTQSNAIAQGRAWGEDVAHRVLAWRAQDGFTNVLPGYFGSTNVGVWRSIPTPTAPDGTLPAVFPQMAVLVPFAMSSPSQFRPGPPYGLPLAQALASAPYAADLNEVKAIGRFDSATRTAEQTSLARLWQVTGAAEENNCVRQVVPPGNSLVDNARLFALLNIVAADTVVAGFDSKYTYNFWRPHHAIRFADLDGNPDTTADPEWAGVFVAPRHQEYISNHAVFTGGFMHALRRLLGDTHTFTLSSADFPGFTWTFQHFSDAAAQVKEARIWAGIHYRNSCNVGGAIGQQIADYVLDNFLRPAVPLAITQQPQDQTALVGSTATFTVEATGTPPLTYQWLRLTNLIAYSEIPGATNAALTLTNVQPTGLRFRVVISDGFGASVTSAPPTKLTVVSPPVVTSQPGEVVTATEGEAFTLGVTASGTRPLAFQWKFNGQPLSGAASSNLTFVSVQSSNAGAYQIVITNLYGAATSQVSMLTVVPPTLFTRVTNGPVATDLGQAACCVWADFDNDGFPDLYVTQYFSPTNFFYRNNRDGTFTRITQGDVLVTSGYNFTASVADYDNDGWLDLIVTTAGSSPIPRPNVLFHNNRDFTFTRVNAGGITNQVGYFPTAQWADYDNDGFVDLLITQSDSTERGAYTNILWHNSGDGNFVGVGANALQTDRMSGWGLLWSDYDNDGLIDAFVASTSSGTNFLYHNAGSGTFMRVNDSVVATDAYTSGGSQAADGGDYDNDGWTDLFVADSGGGQNHLYHNEGGGKFSNVLVGPMLTPPPGSTGRSVAWGDYDNDGFLDLLVGYLDRNVIYRNNHDGTFTEIRSIAPATDRLSDSTAFFDARAWVDYDNDGFLDLFSAAGSLSNLQIPNLLYRNAGNTNGWLEVKCIGTVANRAAIGAKIRVKATIDGNGVWQLRELKSGGGEFLATPLVAHFGLGDATNVETLRIEWPSGTVQELHDVPPRQIVTITEPPRLTAANVSGQPQFTLKGGRNMTYEIEGSTNLRDWSFVTSVTITNMRGTASVFDPAPAPGHTFYRATHR